MLARMREDIKSGQAPAWWMVDGPEGWPKIDDRLQRSDRDWTRSRNDAVHRGASRDPHSDAGRRTEEAA
jgi:hypothetical protein